MANDFLTPSLIQDATERAALMLENELVAANLINRDIENTLVGSSGGTVTVRYQPVTDADLDESTAGKKSLTTEDVDQEGVEVDATNYVHKKRAWTTKQATFDLDNFTRDMLSPMVKGMARTIDKFLIRRIVAGSSAYVSGTAGTAPDAVADVVAARKVQSDNLVPFTGRVGLIGTTAEAAFLQLNPFINADFGSDGPAALREAAIARRYGYDWYVSPHAGAAHDFGDTAGTVSLGAAVTTGDTEVQLTGFDAATGTVRAGARFHIGSSTGSVYAVTEDAEISGNAATVKIHPAAENDHADTTSVTFKAAHTSDVLYNRNMMAGAIVAPPPMSGLPSETYSTSSGLTVRLTFDGSTSGSNGAEDSVLLDVYVGAKMIRPEAGVIMQKTS